MAVRETALRTGALGTGTRAAARTLARRVLTGLAAGLLLCWGCAAGPRFPAAIETHSEKTETVRAFDASGDGRVDFWQYLQADGRIHALAYAADQAGCPGPRIDLGEVDPNECPHFLIALDGVPYDVVDQLYRDGSFRLFHPPARVLCPFPAMTDLALAAVFHTAPCPAYQALYFDRPADRLSDSTAVYLSGRNSPWARAMTYRCSFWWDTLVYLDPQPVFDHELRGMLRAFRGVDAGEAYAYSVGSAGLGTRGGRPAMEAYLRLIDQLCERIVYERQGRVKITLTADHGHDLVENRVISFDQTLIDGGYRSANSLHKPRDVVTIAYGLVTYAEFHTTDPAGVAQCLLKHEDVEFACYPDGDTVIVCNRAGRARITKGARGFVYDAHEGDPLKLAAIIEKLRIAGKVTAAGEIDGAALFDATLEQYYPDPLARVWEAFNGLVENPPDVIVNLRDGACHGSHFFHAMLGKVASTHGSLNRMNSTAFVLTMLGDLPPVLRSSEVLPALEKLRGQPQP
jgi:hypothetical protein